MRFYDSEIDLQGKTIKQPRGRWFTYYISNLIINYNAEIELYSSFSYRKIIFLLNPNIVARSLQI